MTRSMVARSVDRVRVALVAVVVLLASSVATAQVFGPPRTVSDGSRNQEPRVATDGVGSWVAVWEHDPNTFEPEPISFSRSTDGGVTWSSPAALDTVSPPDAGLPTVETDGAGTWLAAWTSRFDLGGTIGTDPDLFLARSTDGGASWSVPVPLNTTATTDNENDDVDLGVDLATDGAGTWMAVWKLVRGPIHGGDGDVVVSRSTDDGTTWSPPVIIASGSYAPRIATGGTGTWVVVWYSVHNSVTDILVSRSVDDGVTWTAPAFLNDDAPTDVGDDWDPTIATDGAGTWLAAWTSEETLGGLLGDDWDILVARSTDDGATWSAPAALNTNATQDKGLDAAVALVTDRAGTWMAVWSSNKRDLDPDWDLLLARSTDDGLTWTPPTALATTALSDDKADIQADVATDGAGKWMTVWAAIQNGPDDQILAASGGLEVGVGVEAQKLLILDKLTASGRAKTVFVSKDETGAIRKDVGTALDGIDVTLHLAYTDGSATGAFVVPVGAYDGTSGWILNDDSQARYANGLAPGGDTQAKSAIVRPGRGLKLTAKGIGDTAFDIVAAGPPAVVGLGAVVSGYCVRNGDVRMCHCSAFPECLYKPVAGGSGAKLVCKNGVPDDTCAAVPDL